MRSSVQSVAWPPVLTGQAAILAALIQQYERTERQSTAEIQQQQYAQLGVLAAYAEKHSPFFKRRLAAAGLKPEDLASPEGLRCLPLLTRRDAQEAGDDLFCATVPPTHMPQDVARSSGSTGEPVTVRKTALGQLFFQANMMREHFWHKRDFSQRLLVFRGRIETPGRKQGWGYPVDLLYPSGEIMGFSGNTPPEDAVRHILDFRPYHLTIYPNLLEAVINHCERAHIRIDSVRHIWSIAETLKPELRAKAAGFFNASVEDDYSCNEIGIMALQCPDTGLYHEMSESVILEILNDDGQPCRAGETGRVVVTDLHNFATPLIRYDVGDYAERGAPCACGRGLPTIVSIKGRKRNFSFHPDGTYRQLALTLAIFKAQLPIYQFQLVQHKLDDVEIKLVTARPLTSDDEKILLTCIQDALGYACPLRIVYFEGRLPRPDSGKFEDFISYV